MIHTVRHGPFRYFTCSCGREQAVNAVMPWCAGCRIEYDLKPGRVILRPNRKTTRYAVAKAFQDIGLRIGCESEYED
jgi:hypothetical protein